MKASKRKPGHVRAVDAREACVLPPDKLCRTFDPHGFKFKTTTEVKPLEGTIGQEKGVAAIDFGLNVKTHGFNLYVAGPTGTGRNSSVKAYVKTLAAGEKVADDWCYVHNFSAPDMPSAIHLPAGLGCEFARDMDELIKHCQADIPRAFETETYEEQKNSVLKDYSTQRDHLVAELQKNATVQGLSIQVGSTGIATVPLSGDKQMTQEEYENLPEDKREVLRKKSDAFQNDINQVLAKTRKLEKQAKDKIKELDQKIAIFSVGHIIDSLQDKYKKVTRVKECLEHVRNDIIEHVDDYKSPSKEQPQLFGMGLPMQPPSYEKYRVNLFVENCGRKSAPVVVENNPTYYNLFGRIDYETVFGGARTNFTQIKPGAVHRANGGYLVLQALDVLMNFLSWDALKRTIKNQESVMENIGEQYRTMPSVTLRPEPIPMDFKVVLVGSHYIYRLLYALDEDFKKLFKVRADFDTEMSTIKEHVDKYASFVSARCSEAKLRAFDRTGVARLVEHGMRLTEDQDKLSTRFIEIADIISEASYWAQKAKSRVVKAEHVEEAIDQKCYRSNLVEEKVQEYIEDGTIMIDTEGTVAGQVNGLSIYQLGDYTFGKPSRITARTFVGKSGVVDIERETKLSGSIHNKGVMILSGYLGGKFAHDKPLSISASLCFEQLYEEVEGDSASSTELYALLSSLSEVPVKQGIAVTGSVNQQGMVQPIGGVNQKIEGFYDVCKAKGLTGEQGVMIPHQNVRNLMLKKEIVDAVRKKKFHVWGIKTVDEGIEILTGVPAGKRMADGRYQKGTINYLVEEKLLKYDKRLSGKDQKAKKTKKEKKR